MPSFKIELCSKKGLALILCAFELFAFAPNASARPLPDPVEAPVELGRQQMRILVQLRPGDINCVEAHRRAGRITETVDMILSPKLTLTGTHRWTDWVVPEGAFDPSRPFDHALLNEFQRFEQKNLRLITDAQNGLECRHLENRVNLVFKAQASDLNNEIQLRRVFADETACTDTLTALSQSLEARGRTWLSTEVTGHRRLWTTTRGDRQDFDTIRVERIETEIEGLKFVGTNFIQTSSGGTCEN